MTTFVFEQIGFALGNMQQEINGIKEKLAVQVNIYSRPIKVYLSLERTYCRKSEKCIKTRVFNNWKIKCLSFCPVPLISS